MITRSAPATTSSTGRPRLPVDSVSETVRRPGAKRAASADQLDTTLVGATTRNGGPSGSVSRARTTSARVCSVLPRPMSSARIPPSWWLQRKLSQRRPSSWYGRSCGLQPGRRRSIGSIAVVPASPRTAAFHCTDWSISAPRAARSSHRLVWKRLIDSSGCGRSTSAWDSAISSRSAVNSGRSRSKYTPVSRTRYSSPRARATNSSSNGTSSPSTVTLTWRSNQSVARGRGVAATRICGSAVVCR